MKKEKTMSWKEFTEKISDLCEIIKNLDTSLSKYDAAEYACFQIITQTADNCSEALGILQEVMLSSREASIVAFNDKYEWRR